MARRPEETVHEHFAPEAADESLLVYVKWDVIRQWKSGRRRTVPFRPQLPYVYGSGNSTFRSYVRPGVVIWAVTCPDYGDSPRVQRLPPMLLARLHVMQAAPWSHWTILPGVAAYLPGSRRSGDGSASPVRNAAPICR